MDMHGRYLRWKTSGEMWKMIKVNLHDRLSTHSEAFYGHRSFTPFVKPKLIEYHPAGLVQPGIDYCTDDSQLISVFTDKSFTPSLIKQDKASKKVAWIVECREVHPPAYKQVIIVEDEIDYIFTFDELLLKRGDKYVLTPIASSRIVDNHANLYKKSKLISLIASDKRWCSGHKFRHQIAANNYDKVDLWGRAFKKMPEGAKVLALAEYSFSITVENSKGKNYFTEKLIDCFRTGTVPIYWGCPNVGDFFDEGGIISFNELSELEEILKNLNFEEYHKRFESVKRNFNLAKQWTSMDDTFAKKLMEKCGNE